MPLLVAVVPASPRAATGTRGYEPPRSDDPVCGFARPGPRSL